MAALVVPGAPVSVLVDHGLSEAIVEKLMAGDVPTVERLGSMTPEQLEELPGIDQEMVESIQLAVNSYYGQFEAAVDGQPAEEAPTEEAPATEAPPEEAAAPSGEEAIATEAASEAAVLENESVTIDNIEPPEVK